MRKHLPIRIAAIVALAGSATVGAVLATAGPGAAAKVPTPVTCTGIAGSGTVAQATSLQPLTSVVTGCTGDHSTSTGVSVTVLANSGGTAGTTTVTFENKKTATYTFTVTSNPSLACPTFLGQAAADKETITAAIPTGTAKVTAGGTINACAYIGSDGTLYEDNLGSFTF